MFVDLPAPGRRLGRAVIFRQALWPTVGGPARTTSARSDSEADVRRGYHASANVRWTVTSARPVSKYLDHWQFEQCYANVRWSLSCRLGPSKEARPGPLARARGTGRRLLARAGACDIPLPRARAHSKPLA